MTLDYKKIFHFLFPLSKDELRIEKMTKERFLTLASAVHTNETTALLSYTHPTVRSAVHLLKFHNHSQARILLGCVLAEHIKLICPTHKKLVLVPIPLSSKRFRQRGYNQVTEVIKEALKQGAPGTLADTILKRTRNTTPQTSLSREERLINLKGAFCAVSQQIAGTHLILIDDVTTTGTTLAEAKDALVPLSSARITCIALAH